MLAPDEITPGPAAEPEAPLPLASGVERRVVLVEMAAVLCLAVVLGRLWPVVLAHLFLNLLVFLHA